MSDITIFSIVPRSQHSGDRWFHRKMVRLTKTLLVQELERRGYDLERMGEGEGETPWTEFRATIADILYEREARRRHANGMTGYRWDSWEPTDLQDEDFDERALRWADRL